MLRSRSAGNVKRGMLSSSSSDVLVCDFFVRKYFSRGAGRCSLHSLVGARGIIRGGLRVDIEGWSWWCVVVVVGVSDGDGTEFRVGTEGSGFAWLDVTGARPSLARDAFFFFFFFLFFFLFGGWDGSGGSDMEFFGCRGEAVWCSPYLALSYPGYVIPQFCRYLGMKLQ